MSEYKLEKLRVGLGGRVVGVFPNINWSSKGCCGVNGVCEN